MHSGRRLTAEVSREIFINTLLVPLRTANVLFVRILRFLDFLLVSISQAERVMETSVLFASRYKYFVQRKGSKVSVKYPEGHGHDL